MSTNPNKRSPSVKPNEHSGFAFDLAQYLNHLRGEMSGREFARQAAAGTNSHWAAILAMSKVMTTNDIKVAADVFGISPYEFVAKARLHAIDVGGSGEDVSVLSREEEQALRLSDLDLAALRGRDDTDNPASP